MAKSERLQPIHPGEILREDFMKPLGISMNRLALDLRVRVTRIAEIVHDRRGITPDTGTAAMTLFQHQRALLDECPIQLRPGGRTRRIATQH